jgi:hypothetical protein
VKRVGRFAAALAIYGVASAALFYRPGLADGTYYFGNGSDPFLSMWMFTFLPDAVAHGHNPFILPQAWAPDGLNITQTTTTPLLALAAWPLTALAGPVVAFNIVSLAIPALDAAAAYALIAAVTRHWWAALIGGWIFGFSSSVFGPLQGHLQTSFVMVVPLMFLCLVLRLQGRISPGLCVAGLGLLGVCEFLISLETYVTMAMFLALFAAVAQAGAPGGVKMIISLSRRNLLLQLAAGFAVTAFLASPYIYYFFSDYHEIPHLLQDGSEYATNVLNFFVPTNITWAGGVAARPVSLRFAGNPAEQLGYIGLPLFVLTAVAAWRIWPIAAARPMIVTMLAAMIFSLGPRLHIGAWDRWPMPWRLMATLPLMGNALPSRLMIFAMLFIGAVCALWLSGLRRYYGAACMAVLAAAALMLPASRNDGCDRCWYSAVPRAAFFDSGAYRKMIPPGQTVLFMPFGPVGGDATYWQVATGGYFRTVNGYGNFVPPGESLWPAANILQMDSRVVPASAFLEPQFNEFMKADGARFVIVPAADVSKWDGFLRAAGWTGQDAGGVSLYEIADAHWAAIRVRSPAVARLSFDEAHLTALGEATRCGQSGQAGRLNIPVAMTAHCLDPAFAAASFDPRGNWDNLSGWLGDLGGRRAAGIVIGGREAKQLLASPPAGIETIYYPYPHVYDPARRLRTAPALLLLVYSPAAR